MKHMGNKKHNKTVQGRDNNHIELNVHNLLILFLKYKIYFVLNI